MNLVWPVQLAGLLPLAAALVVVALHPSPYATQLASFVGIGTLYAMSLNMIWGFAGQFSMGQMALASLGAYVSALAVIHLGLNPWLALLPALLVALVAALLLGLLALRLRGFYFSIVTLAAAQILLLVLYNADFAGGPSGLVVSYALPDITLGRLVLLHMNTAGYVVLLGLLISALMLAQDAFMRSRSGRAIIAVREEEILARSLGIAPTRHKLLAFLISTLPACLAGWLAAPLISYLTPTAFGLDSLLDQISMVVIGGAGTVLGPFAGAVIVVLLPELLRFAGAMRIVGYSVVLILTVIFMPQGLVGLLAALRTRRPVPRTAPTGRDIAAPVSFPHDDLRLLEVNNLGKRYGGIIAVGSVSLSLRAGQTVGLIGPNGAGKTTLFDMISGFARPSHGAVHWLGRAGRPPERLARAGMVRTFQHARLFARLSVADNLLTAAHLPGRGLLDAATPAERVARTLTLCGLEPWADLLAAQLPYGVGKRVGVALGLITEPRLLMLDEPAAGLTAAERQALADLLGRISRLGIALLVIEHDIAFVGEVCARIVVLAGGEVICDGSIAEVRANPAVVEAYLGGAPEEDRAPMLGETHAAG